MANTSQTRLAYIAESTWGTTPATPAFNEQRFTGENLNANIANTTSNEIRSDRNVSDLVQTGQTAGGSVDTELSYGAFDTWLESLLYSTWSSDVLKNGVTEKSLTLEKTFETGATDQFHRIAGAVCDTLELNVNVGEIVTASWGFMGKSMTSAQAQITGATYSAATANPVISAEADFGSLSITGATSPALTALSLNIANNLGHQRQLGSLDARGIRSGRFEVTGQLTAYFENEELFELFLAGTAADLSFKLGGASSKNYVFDIPNLKFTNASVVSEGNDGDLLVTMDFQGLYDSGEASTLKITRTA